MAIAMYPDFVGRRLYAHGGDYMFMGGPIRDVVYIISAGYSVSIRQTPIVLGVKSIVLMVWRILKSIVPETPFSYY